MKKIKKKPINQIDYFYKQQFRKDIIDKFNICYVHELDLNCKLKFRGFLRYNAFDKNPMSFKQILAYQYIFESIFSQRVLFEFFSKKKIQRDEPPDYFYTFKCNIGSRKKVYFFLYTLYANLYNHNLHGTLKKPLVVCDFEKNLITFKKFKSFHAFWIKNFLDINLNAELNSVLQIKTKPFLFLMFLSRLQFMPFLKVSQAFFGEKDVKISKYNTTRKLINEAIVKI